MIKMTIIDERKKNVEIYGVRAGQVFEYETMFYIMTDDGDDFTAVDLLDGTMRAFNAGTVVKLCEAKLAISG